jgi:uncharacterized paraquat-inducible protein A
MPAANHVHRYKKVNLGRSRGTKNNKDAYWVYRCMKPNCTHYIPIKLAEGQQCECNRCGMNMIITRVQLYGSSQEPMTKPHCNACIRKRTKNENIFRT